MGSNIFSIGTSALNAAQVGLSTAGHNIANASTPGYNRQTVVQTTAVGQNYGFGFIGHGTQVATIQRVYNQFLSNQVNASQTAKASLDTYYTQISRIDNLLADTAAGLSPALQGFFTGIQDLASNPNMAASRQTTLSAAQTLAARFQSLNSQMAASRDDVNAQITSSVTSINAYARQIAQLNEAIQKASVGGQPPNDLLDQRDQVIADLGKEVKVTVSKEGGNYNITIGNGQQLVMGNQASALTTIGTVDDAARLQVGYVTPGGTARLPEAYLSGGKLGGLFEFRSQTLDVAQNELGRVAIGLAMDFNAQHMQGLDQKGNPGQAFFQVGKAQVAASAGNTSGAVLDATISDSKALTSSNYRLQYDGSNYTVTRLSDGTSSSFASLPQTVDGVDFSVKSGTLAAGDSFLVKPTVTGAEDFKVLITDTTKIAAAGNGPAFFATAGSGNTGSGKVAANPAAAAYAGPALPAGARVELKFNGTDFDANIVNADGSAGGAVPAAAFSQTGAPPTSVNVYGTAFDVSGTPATDDTFIVSKNNNVGDNGNALKLGELQSKSTLAGGTTSYQGAYSQLVSLIGNKTHELDVNRTAEGNLLATVRAAQQSESGVNLDEEAANIMRFQQAYQAAAKVMQTASTMFDTLLSLGH